MLIYWERLTEKWKRSRAAKLSPRLRKSSKSGRVQKIFVFYSKCFLQMLRVTSAQQCYPDYLYLDSAVLAEMTYLRCSNLSLAYRPSLEYSSFPP